jgi:hypothetical protein
MFEKHKDRGGNVLMICEMGDSHLINTIKMILRKIKEISIFSMNEDNIDVYEQELYEYSKIDKKKAANLTKKASIALAPYILELCLRGLSNEIETDLQTAFSRNKQFIRKYNMPLLINEQHDNDECESEDN